MKKKSIKHLNWIALAALLAALPALFTGLRYTYAITVLCFASLYIIATSGLDILYGYCGQISMGHAAYFAIGAYGSVMLNHYFGIPVILTMILASCLAALIGSIIAYPSSKLVFHFLSLSTIAFGEIVHSLLLNSPGGVTNNAVGMAASSIRLFGFQINTATRFYYFGLIMVVAFLFVKQRLIASRVGRAWIAIRENAVAANGMGIHVTKYKVLAFACSAFYTGFAGAMYAHFVNYVSPDTFVQKQSVMFITMLLFGGTGSLVGPIIGSCTVMLLNESLRSLEQYQMLVYGILLLIVVVAMPGGLYGYGRSVLERVNRRKGGKKNAA